MCFLVVGAREASEQAQIILTTAYTILQKQAACPAITPETASLGQLGGQERTIGAWGAPADAQDYDETE